MELLSYLLKVSACTVLFFSLYLLVLRKFTFFRINRYYLLLTLLLSFVIPAMQFSIDRKTEKLQVIKPVSIPKTKQYSISQKKSLEVIQVPDVKQEINWLSIISYSYFAIASSLLLFFIWQLFQLIKHTRNCTKHLSGLKLISKTTGFTNCSFFNYVFINEGSLSEEDLVVLLQHEKVHANQYHSIDKIILMICKSILWFNPVIYFLDKALEQTHEYEADEVTSSNFRKDVYATLLLKLSISKNDISISHNFSKSPVKQRIKMLFNSKSSTKQSLWYFMTLPIMICSVWLFAINVVYSAPKINSYLVSQKSETLNEKHVFKKDKEALNSKKNRFNLKLNDKSLDTIKLQKAIIPKIIASSKINGNMKTKISHFEDLILEILGSTVKAKSVEWNQNENTLTADNAIITNGGSMVIAERAIFNLLDGTYRTYESKVSSEGNNSFIDFDLKEKENMIAKKIQYSADSVRIGKDKNTITIMGRAKMFFKDIKMEADEIIYNNKSLTGSAKNMVITQMGSGTKIKGSNATFNLSGKVEIWQNEKGDIVVEP